MKSVKFIKTMLSLVAATLFSVLFITCTYAAVEVGENYVMFDFREYDGNSSLPYGKGSNGNCYYPRGDNTEYVFPEVYTWSYGALTETDEGARLYASKANAIVSTTVDKMPPLYMQAVEKHFKYLVLRIKTNAACEGTITFSSLGNNYRRIYPVTFKGEWQTVTLDLSGSDGWTNLQGDGSYKPMTTGPWDNSYFGADGFALAYSSFGESVRNEIFIDYYAYSDTPDILLETGKTESLRAYLKGDTNGLIRPNDSLTRRDAAIIICRLQGYSDDEINAPDGYKCRFSDLSKSDYGYHHIAVLDSLGIFTRYSGKFLPDEPITADELCSMLINAKVTGESDGALFEITGQSDTLTRAEAVALINTVTERTVGRGFPEDLFPDISPAHPLYSDVASSAVFADVKHKNGGDIKVLSVYDEPNYALSESVIAEIDQNARELYESIHNSLTEITPSEKSYYVSPNGNDSNSGTSPSNAWKTLDKVNAVGFSAGSTVFFERGGLWRGSLRILPNVTYTAYGDGEKPTIYGSLYDGADEKLWTLVEGTNNIWRFKYDMLDCGSVVFNHGEYHSDKETPSYNGTTYLHRNSSRVFNYKTDISENLGIFCDNKRNVTEKCPLYMRCDEGNPGALFDSIEFMPRQNIMNVVANQNVVIDNFCLKYGGAHGIGAGTLKNFTVTNCEFIWIGGSIQNYNSGGGTMPVRYGNAVESYGAPDGYYVENNYIHQVYDAGITHQMSGGTQSNGIQKNIRYANNLIEYCSYSVEYFLGSGEAGTPERYMENVIIEDNIMRYSGFGFGNQRTDRLCMSHIKSGGSDNKSKGDFVIRNNIFDRSREMLICIGATDPVHLPVLSGNTYIQYETLRETPNSTLGKYGAHPARLRFYTKDVESVIKKHGIDSNPSVYFVQRDWLYELPEY